MIYSGKYPMGAWEEVLFCWWTGLCMCIRYIWHSVVEVLSFLIFCLYVVSATESAILKNLLLLLYCCLFLPLVLSIFSFFFRCSDVGCTFIYNCYIFLISRSVYHYMISYCVSSHIFLLKAFFLYKYSWTCSLLVTILMEYSSTLSFPVFLV